MPTQGDRPRRIALVIATSRYQEESLTHLRAPGTDAKELAEVLADTRLGGFEVQTLLDAPHDQLMRGVLELCSGAGAGRFRARLLVLPRINGRPRAPLLRFNGHGTPTASGHRNFCCLA
jgi:hypothetical protein